MLSMLLAYDFYYPRDEFWEYEMLVNECRRSKARDEQPNVDKELHQPWLERLFLSSKVNADVGCFM